MSIFGVVRDRTNFLKNKKLPYISWENFVDSNFMLNFAALKLKTVLEERDLRDLHVGTRYTANIGFDNVIGLDLSCVVLGPRVS